MCIRDSIYIYIYISVFLSAGSPVLQVGWV
jgi:hypothetical protein